MTKVNLQSTNSIIDYLSFQKKDSSYSARKKLYQEKGLNKRLGSFTGTGDQNTALLKTLRSEEETLSTEKPATHITQLAKNLGTFNQPVKEPVIPFEIPPSQTAHSTPMMIKEPSKVVSPSEVTETIQQGEPKPDPITDLFNNMAPPQETSFPTSVTAPSVEQDVSTEEVGTTLDQTTKQSLGFSASDFIPDFPSEAELINKYLSSSEFDLLLEKTQLKNQTAEAKAEYAKQQLEAKYQSEKTSLENALASRGLAFSGIRATQVKALVDTLVASQLNVDREFASKLLDADINFRESIMKGVAELVSDAKDEKKEAIAQLNKVGLAVINGTLVPTLTALKEERVAKSEAFKNELSLIKEERLQRQEALAKTQFVTVGGRVQLRDKQTGELIADIGASSTGTKTKFLTAEDVVTDFNNNPVLQGFIGQSRDEVFELFTMEQPPTDFVSGFAEEDENVSPEAIQEAWDEIRSFVLSDLAGSPIEEQFSNNDIALVQEATGLSFDETKQMNPERFNKILQKEKKMRGVVTMGMVLDNYSE